MSLAAGTRLGPYEVLSPLGAGGMGEVYRARDTRLGREVAIKVLPADLAGDPERVARFEREARAASALSHAHAVSVFDVGRAGERFYLVTEIVEGGSLRDAIDRGPLPLRRAMDLLIQIASGLAAAHEQGIVHRDLKPDNILIAKSGEAKIADFGLAKLMEPSGDANSRMLTSDGMETSAGVVMGTVAYMSPEQASGRTVDFRSDQFAFGAVVWEMLAGRSCFRRASAAETLSAIMRDEPEAVRTINPAVPAQLAWIIDRCLAKEPAGRYASTRDLASELATVREHLSDLTRESAAGAGPPAVPARRRRTLIFGAVAGAAALAAAVFATLLIVRHPAPAGRAVMRFQIPPPADARFFGRFDGVTVAFSPDGARLAFIAEGSATGRRVAESEPSPRRIWVRNLSDLDARPVAGTEGASSIFWSPDGRAIGFFTGEQLKRIDLAGGSAVPICDLPHGMGMAGTWGDGEILFDSTIDGLIYRVSADGGSPTLRVRPDPARGEAKTRWPWFLPDGKAFLYVAMRKDGESELMFAARNVPPRAVASISSRVEYSEPGFLVFARDGALFAQRFDAKAARLKGPLIPVAPSVYYFFSTRWAGFASSRSGTMAYAPRGDITRLAWFDRSGRQIEEIGSEGAGETISIAISPDGGSALFDRTRLDLGTYDVWTIDFARGVETRITSEPTTEFDPVWFPDGKHLVYSAARQGQPPQVVRRSLAGGPETPLLSPGTFQEALGVTPDGRRLLFSQSGEKGSWGLWTLSLDGRSAPAPVVVSKSVQEFGRLSPDGEFVAFLSNESGRMEAYLRAFDASGDKVRLSTGGATQLRWSRDGKEIFYTSPDGRLYAISVRTSPALGAGSAAPLFVLPAGGWAEFDVAPDGRFLAAVRQVSNKTEPFTVVANWTSEIPR